jgi:hypothetical protein
MQALVLFYRLEKLQTYLYKMYRVYLKCGTNFKSEFFTKKKKKEIYINVCPKRS